MLIIYDLTTKKKISDTGFNSTYRVIPEEDINSILQEGQGAWQVNDTGVFGKKIETAAKYEIVFDGDVPVGINVIKTKAQAKAERVPTAEEINQQVVQKIREQYSQDEEMKMLRLGTIDSADAKYQTYLQHVSDCIAWGDAEKEKWGLS